MNGWFDDWRGYAFEDELDGGPAWIRTRVSAPLEEILPRYAAAMKRALEAGDFDDVARMLDLLEALGGPS